LLKQKPEDSGVIHKKTPEDGNNKKKWKKKKKQGKFGEKNVGRGGKSSSDGSRSKS